MVSALSLVPSFSEMEVLRANFIFALALVYSEGGADYFSCSVFCTGVILVTLLTFYLDLF